MLVKDLNANRKETLETFTKLYDGYCKLISYESLACIQLASIMSTLTNSKREKSKQLRRISDKCSQMGISAASADVGNNPIWLAELPVVLSLSWNSVHHIVASMAAMRDDCTRMVGNQARRDCSGVL